MADTLHHVEILCMLDVRRLQEKRVRCFVTETTETVVSREVKMLM